MSKVRINDLARELEVKSKAILDTLALVGVTEKKTHSSSLEEHEAEKVRVLPPLLGGRFVLGGQGQFARIARRRRNQNQNRSVKHFPSWRCAASDYAAQGSCGAASRAASGYAAGDAGSSGKAGSGRTTGNQAGSLRLRPRQ